MSPRNYLSYTLLLLLFTGLALYAGTWLLALVARAADLQPGEPLFNAIAGGGLALIGAFLLWSLTAMAAKRARDAHFSTIGFKTGVPALVLFDRFGAAQMTDERLVGPLANFTPLVAFGLAAVFLFLLLSPRAPIKPLHGPGSVERAEADHEAELVRLYG